MFALHQLRRILGTVLSVALVFSIASCSGPVGPGSPALTTKDMSAFSFASPAATGVFVGTAISVAVPSGTNVTALVATFTTDGASVKVGSATQTSGVTANDFTDPVKYTVTAEDGSTQDYTVTVTVASSSSNSFLTFSLAGVAGTTTGNAIGVSLPYGSSTTQVATFTTSGSYVTVNGVTQVSGTTSNTFSPNLTYIVHAADGSTQSYNVVLTILQDSVKTIDSFSFHSPSTVGIISDTNITLDIPFGYDISHLKADLVLTSSNSSVTVNGTAQVNNSTYNSFVASVPFLVTAQDGSTLQYDANARFVLSTEVVSGTGASGSTDTAGGTPSFGALNGVASDGNNIYVADSSNYKIRKIVKFSGVVTTIAGTGSSGSTNNATGTSASFNGFSSLTINPAGTFLYSVSGNSLLVRKISTSSPYAVTTLGTLPSGAQPTGVAADENGNVYAASGYTGIIYKITSGGTVTVLAGLAGSQPRPRTDATGASASFVYPRGLVYAGSGSDTLYIGDYRLRKLIISSGAVTTVSNADIQASSASVYSLAYDPNNAIVYAADKYNSLVRGVSIATGEVFTVAGTGATGTANVTNGLGSSAAFGQIENLGWDPMDNYLYVADYDNYVLRRVY